MRCTRLQRLLLGSQGIKIALTDGAAHAVDSSEMAFKLACQYAFREAFGRAKPVILEPVMDVDVRAPAEFLGTIIGDLNRRKGVILNSEGELDDVVMKAQVLPWLCKHYGHNMPFSFACMRGSGMHILLIIDI